MTNLLFSARVRRIALLLTNGALLIPLIVYVYNTIYIRYMADDYCVLAFVRQNGVIGTAQNLYVAWSGRFVNSIVVSAALGAGWQISALFVSGTLIVWWIASFGVLRYVTRKLQWNYPDLLAAIGVSSFLLVLFNSALSLVQSVYWISGIFLYTAPLVLFTLYVWLLVEWNLQRFRSMALVICFLLTFLASGFAELSGLTQTAALLVALVACLRYPVLRLHTSRLVAGLLGSVLAFGLVVIAPGNFVRLSLNTHLDILSLILGSAVSPAVVIWTATMYSVLTPFTILGLPILAGFAAGPRPIKEIRRYLILLPIVVGVLAALSFALTLYTTASPPPERAWIIPQFILFCGLGIWGYLIGHKISPSRRSRRMMSLVILTSATIVVLIWFTSLSRALALSSGLRQYATEWDIQDSAMRVRGNRPDSLAIAPIPVISGPVKLSEERTVWAYRCAAVYYDLPAIAYNPALTNYIESKSLGWPDFSAGPTKSPTDGK